MFKDRIDAGEKLANKLEKYKGESGVIILGIPRGGVVTASVVAKLLNLPLDIIVIKKIGFPGNEEFAIGAASPETFHIDKEKIREFHLDKSLLDNQIETKQKEARERYSMLLEGGRPKLIKGKTVIVIDDGIATGETIRLAVKILKDKGAKKVIVAVPVAPKNSLKKLGADEVLCVLEAESLNAIGEFYEDFSQIEDEQVKEILKND